MSSASFRRGISLCRWREQLFFRYFATSSSGVAKRTSECNPGSHSYDQIGLYYRIDDSVTKALFGLGGFPKSFSANLDSFGETCLMVRKPALDIITLLKKTDFNKPAIRYLLFGKPGCGKSISLAQVLHYAYLNDFIIVHVPWVWNWMRNNRIEVAHAWKPVSESVSGQDEDNEQSTESSNITSKDKQWVDLPLIAAAWLKHFQLQNARILESNKLELTETLVWSQRETTKAGTPITDLISHGINRVKYACAVVEALISQLKNHANNNRCRVLVAVDGFNAIFGERTHLKRDDRSYVLPSQITLSRALLDATSNDWKNGAVIVTVDQLSGPHETLKSHFPLYLLGRKGFEHLDPFISIHVNELSTKEVESMLDYYEDRKWIQRKGGRHELAFLSNRNPYQLMNLCAPL